MKKFFAILLSAALLVSMFVVFAPAAEATNVALDATVTVAQPGAKPYKAVLNDGAAADVFDTGVPLDWFSFFTADTADANVDENNVGTVVLDLATATVVSQVKVHFYNPNAEDGNLAAPLSATVYFSADGSTYDEGTALPLSDAEGAYWATLDVSNVTAEAVKIEVACEQVDDPSYIYYTMLNEIEVYGVDASEVSSSSVASSEVSSDASSEVSSDASSEVSSDVSSEVSSDVSSDVSSEESSAPAASLADQLKELVGEDNADSKFDMVINVPETYVPGESITVEVTLANVQAIVKEGGAADGADMYLHLVEGQLFYNNEFLTLTNTIEENVLLALDETKGFEDWCKVVADNQIEVSALTEKTSASYSKKDGELVFKFTFDVSEDATGDLGFYITSESVWGSSNAAEGNAYGTTKVVGNGSYAIIGEYVEEESSSSVVESSSSTVESSSSVAESTEAPTPVEPGDASVGFVVFAILAVVAIAGSAVVIKSRR